MELGEQQQNAYCYAWECSWGIRCCRCSANATHAGFEPFIIATKSNRHAIAKTKLQIRNTEHPAPCKPENTRHQQTLAHQKTRCATNKHQKKPQQQCRRKTHGSNKKTAAEAMTKSQDRTEEKPESHHRHNNHDDNDTHISSTGSKSSTRSNKPFLLKIIQASKQTSNQLWKITNGSMLRKSNTQQQQKKKTEKLYQSPNLCWVMEELRRN